MKVTADVETLSGQFSESYLGVLGYMKVYF
jgi:hypothetical protein